MCRCPLHLQEQFRIRTQTILLKLDVKSARLFATLSPSAMETMTKLGKTIRLVLSYSL